MEPDVAGDSTSTSPPIKLVGGADLMDLAGQPLICSHRGDGAIGFGILIPLLVLSMVARTGGDQVSNRCSCFNPWLLSAEIQISPVFRVAGSYCQSGESIGSWCSLLSPSPTQISEGRDGQTSLYSRCPPWEVLMKSMGAHQVRMDDNFCSNLTHDLVQTIYKSWQFYYKNQSIGELAVWLKEINFHSRTCQEVVLLAENMKGNSAAGKNVQEHKHHSPSCTISERWLEDSYAEDVRASLFGCFLRQQMRELSLKVLRFNEEAILKLSSVKATKNLLLSLSKPQVYTPIRPSGESPGILLASTVTEASEGCSRGCASVFSPDPTSDSLCSLPHPLCVSFSAFFSHVQLGTLPSNSAYKSLVLCNFVL